MSFIGRSDCQLLAHVTDTVLVTKGKIEQFRLDQAGTLKRNLDWYRTSESETASGSRRAIQRWKEEPLLKRISYACGGF